MHLKEATLTGVRSLILTHKNHRTAAFLRQSFFVFYFLGGGGLDFAVNCKKRFRRGRFFCCFPAFLEFAWYLRLRRNNILQLTANLKPPPPKKIKTKTKQNLDLTQFIVLHFILYLTNHKICFILLVYDISCDGESSFSFRQRESRGGVTAAE